MGHFKLLVVVVLVVCLQALVEGKPSKQKGEQGGRPQGGQGGRPKGGQGGRPKGGQGGRPNKRPGGSPRRPANNNGGPQQRRRRPPPNANAKPRRPSVGGDKAGPGQRNLFRPKAQQAPFGHPNAARYMQKLKACRSAIVPEAIRDKCREEFKKEEDESVDEHRKKHGEDIMMCVAKGIGLAGENDEFHPDAIDAKLKNPPEQLKESRLLHNLEAGLEKCKDEKENEELAGAESLVDKVKALEKCLMNACVGKPGAKKPKEENEE